MCLGRADHQLGRDASARPGDLVRDRRDLGADGSGRIEFDLKDLEQLGLTKLTTWTPWTEGEVEFEGVWARRLMEAVGARGTEVEARALNDYVEVIPIDDFHRYDVLLAVRMNGQLMRTRDKGPIWIVYPWSGHPELDDF